MLCFWPEHDLQNCSPSSHSSLCALVSPRRNSKCMGWKTVSVPAKKPPDQSNQKTRMGQHSVSASWEAWLSHGLSVATIFHWSDTFNTAFVFACCLFSILYRHCDSFPVEHIGVKRWLWHLCLHQFNNHLVDQVVTPGIDYCWVWRKRK